MDKEKNNVVELDEHRRVWATSRARCGACGHAWVAVWPAGVAGTKDHGWECPRCNELYGVEAERL